MEEEAMKRPPAGGVRALAWGSALTILLTLGASGAALFAQEQAQEPQQEEPAEEQGRFHETVEVTGSLIPRPTLEALSPVTVLEPEAITTSGVTRLEDLLTTLPQVFTYQNSTVSNGATGTATVDLRFLGDVRTLVLINGRRMPVGDVYSTVGDLNFIPAALVKRIDILTGGASSVYGADAVAGVVNFILDNDFEGFKGGVEYGAYEHDNRNEVARRINAEAGYTAPRGSVWDGDVVSANAAFGGKFGDGKGHATVYLDYRHIDAITKDQRDYTNCSLGASDAGPFCGGSGTTPAGLFVAIDRDFNESVAYVLDPSNNELRPRRMTDVYNYGALNYMQRPDRRWLGGGFVNYRFNPHVEGYAEVMFMDDSTEAQIAPSGDFGNTTEINCDNPMLTAQEHELFCTQFGYADDEYANVVILRRSLETGNRYDALRHTAWRLLAGARGEVNREWSYDVYGMHAEVQIPESYHNDLNVDRMQDALLVVGDRDDPSTWRCISGNPGCVPWNIFTAGGVTQAAADYIRTAAFSQNRTQTDILDGRLNGDLAGYGWKLPTASEGVQVALGASYRKESLVIDPDEVERTGNAAGFNGEVTPVDGAYSVKELYVEGRVPLVQERAGAQDLTLELGYRYSDYNLSGRHPTYKAQLSYAPLVALKLRTGIARAVRAPNVVELFTPRFLIASGATDTCQNDPQTGAPRASLEECLRTGVRPEQYGHLLSTPGYYGGAQAVIGGNPRLDPEKADTRTFGVVLTPAALPGFTAALDYYDIDVKGAISSLSPVDIFTVCVRTGDPQVCSLIHRDAAGSLWLTPDGYILDTNQNIGSFTSRGVDVNLSYLVPLGKAGYLDLSLLGSYLIENSIATPAFAYDCAGYFGEQCLLAFARWRHRATVSWETTFNTVLTLGWRMISPVTNDDGSPDPDLGDPTLIQQWKASGSYHYPAYHFFDLAATYTFTKGIQLTVGVNNIFDKEPPLGAGLRAVDYGPGFVGEYDPWGRFVHASLRFAL
jgi:iron complex outermembrane receptor protein